MTYMPFRPTPRRLTTGEPPTLENYRRLSVVLFGDDSAAVRFLDQRIAEQGADELVIVDEAQMIYVLASIDREARA